MSLKTRLTSGRRPTLFANVVYVDVSWTPWSAPALAQA